jgi:hypothetical protein
MSVSWAEPVIASGAERSAYSALGADALEDDELEAADEDEAADAEADEAAARVTT